MDTWLKRYRDIKMVDVPEQREYLRLEERISQNVLGGVFLKLQVSRQAVNGTALNNDHGFLYRLLIQFEKAFGGSSPNSASLFTKIKGKQWNTLWNQHYANCDVTVISSVNKGMKAKKGLN